LKSNSWSVNYFLYSLAAYRYSKKPSNLGPKLRDEVKENKSSKDGRAS